MSIRTFNEQDYQGLTRLHNAVEPEYLSSEEELRHWDSSRDPKIDLRRFVIERAGQIIAAAEFRQDQWMYHPNKFKLDLYVDPKCRKAGLGTKLYQTLLQELKPFKPVLLRTQVREDRPDALRFVAKHHYVEEAREWESRVDPEAVDFAPLKPLLAHVERLGIELKSLVDLNRDPDYKEKLYDLEVVTGNDAPQPEAPSNPDFASWQKAVFDNPNLIPEAYLVAVKDGEYLGLNGLWRAQASPELYNGLTGVKRAWRRKGLAKALKLQNLMWAKEQGVRMVKTWNHSDNKGMLSINEALGFVKQPAWIQFKKTLDH